MVPKHRTVVGVRAFSIRGTMFWNALENSLKVIDKFPQFAKALRVKYDITFDNHPT